MISMQDGREEIGSQAEWLRYAHNPEPPPPLGDPNDFTGRFVPTVAARLGSPVSTRLGWGVFLGFTGVSAMLATEVEGSRTGVMTWTSPFPVWLWAIPLSAFVVAMIASLRISMRFYRAQRDHDGGIKNWFGAQRFGLGWLFWMWLGWPFWGEPVASRVASLFSWIGTLTLVVGWLTLFA